MLPCPLMTSTSVRGCMALELPDEVRAVGVGQHEVDQRDVGHPAGERLFSFGAANSDTRVVAGAPT